MTRILKSLFLFWLVTGIVQFAHAQEGSKIRTVVIDAGHGGKDPGALGHRSKEKDIVLAVALKTGAYIEKNLPDVKVIYTRKDDRFIPLHQRAEIANKNNADFFISIHCNSVSAGNASGAETYVMGLHKNEANLNVAMKENAAILLEDNDSDAYQGFDVNSAESYIRFSLLQDVNLDRSTELAENIQKQFKERVGRKDRGVYQAGFLVLWQTAMPGVLVELGYISNPVEERFLMSENGQVYMASAIFRAFRDYKQEYEKENDQPKPVVIEKPPVINKAIEAGLNYRVQFYTNRREIPVTDKRFRDIPDVKVYYHNGLYKYTSGQYNSLDEAGKHLLEIKNMGKKDAFIVPFRKDTRIDFDEAKQLEQKK